MRAGKSASKKVLDGLAGAQKTLTEKGWQVIVWSGEPTTASVLEDHLANGEKVALLAQDGNLLVWGQPGKTRPWVAGGRRWGTACGALLAALPLD